MQPTPKEVIDAEIERIRKELKHHSISDIAESTGLHVNTVRNIAQGHTTPSMANIALLSTILFAKV